jgi:hypothetical protein
MKRPDVDAIGQLEAEQRAGMAEQGLRAMVLRVILEPGVVDPLDARIRIQHGGQQHGVGALTLETQRQGLCPDGDVMRGFRRQRAPKSRRPFFSDLGDGPAVGSPLR